MLYIGHVNGKSPNSYVLLIRILWFKMLLSNKWHPYELEILFQNNYFQSLTCAINSTLFDQLVHVVMGGRGCALKFKIPTNSPLENFIASQTLKITIKFEKTRKVGPKQHVASTETVIELQQTHDILYVIQSIPPALESCMHMHTSLVMRLV